MVVALIIPTVLLTSDAGCEVVNTDAWPTMGGIVVGAAATMFACVGGDVVETVAAGGSVAVVLLFGLCRFSACCSSAS